MILKLKTIWSILETRNRRKVLIAVVLLFSSSLLDLIGVASVLPFLLSLFDPNTINNNYYIKELKEIFELNDKELIYFLALISFLIIVVNQCLRLLSKWYSLALSESLLFENSRNLFNFYLRRPYRFFLKQNNSHLLQRCTNYVNSTVGGFITPILLIFGSILTSFFVLVLLLIYNPLVTIALFSSLAIFYFTFYNKIKNRVAKISKTLPDHYSNTARTIGDAFGAIKETLIVSNQEYFVNKFTFTAKNVRDAQIKMNLYNQLPMVYIEIFSFGILISIFLALFTLYPDFNQIIPLLGLIAISIKRIAPAIQEVYIQFLQIKFYKSTYSKIIDDLKKSFYFHQSKNLIVNNQHKINFKDKIELKNIKFQYGKNLRNAIDVNLSIKKGNLIGLCGYSGHGKTTLLDIISGLLQQNSGKILIDGAELEKKHLYSWKKKISYVPQFGYLLNDTLAKNIFFGSKKKNYSKLNKILKLINLYNFFKKNNYDYNTKIGENGIRLSGGQQQRLGIARALYMDSDLIILDEATSALDLINSKNILKNIRSQFNNCTIIISTHRVELLKNCNKIFLLKNGKINIAGKYNELKNNKNFKKLKFLSNKDKTRNEI